MGRLSGSSFADFPIADKPDRPDEPILEWPFGTIRGLDRDELRETAYELFFTSCRSSPGFGGGRTPLTYYAAGSDEGGVGGKGVNGGGANMAVTSKIKRGLGLRTRKASPPMRAMREAALAGNAGPASPAKGKQRPMTSAEIMRQQMGVTEHSDARLRKTLMKTLVGQTGKRAETMILPLELLRHLKPSEFADTAQHHCWQRRQLKVLEAGLILHPSNPIDRQNPAALRLREIRQAGESKPIDTGKGSEAMRTLCGAVTTLAWRSPSSSPASEVCHWADGYPFNVHLYLSLIHSVFDLRDETVVLDEVDELMELMKKTWAALGINRMIHNVCFAWALFEQYVMTGGIEPDLISAAVTMLVEVAADARKVDREPVYVKILSAALCSMLGWAERKLLRYHEVFDNGQAGSMENVVGLAMAIAKIGEDVPSIRCGSPLMDLDTGPGNRVDYYIRSALQSAFAKVFEAVDYGTQADMNTALVQLANETEGLAVIEKESFSPLLRRWHPVAAAVAVVTLHNCYGVVLKQYMARIQGLTEESIRVLQTAGKLEKVLVQMVVEDSADCDDGGMGIVREMIPYDVEAVIMSLMRNWIAERLRIGRECLTRAKETESWNPKSKSEPYAQSAVDLMKQVKVTVDEFFDMPASARGLLVEDVVDGLEALFKDYTCFVSSCGNKQSYIPTLPTLTRCNQDTKFVKLWQKAAPCACASATIGRLKSNIMPPESDVDDLSGQLSTSRGTQRLYVRLNTLHYVLALLHAIDESLSSSSSSPIPSPNSGLRRGRSRTASSHFKAARSSIQSAILHVSRVAAYRLIFLDSANGFYERLYLRGVARGRIDPGLSTLKQNLTLLVTVLTDRAQPLAVREVMKASFDAFLMVLLAGGGGRAFTVDDYDAIADDFERLKRAFCREGLVAEEVVERDAEVVEGILGLVGMETGRLIEEFTTAACESSGLGAGIGVMGMTQKVPMPPTTGRWNRSDPNTVLRVLCHRNDEAASLFLKKTFQLPKRR